MSAPVGGVGGNARIAIRERLIFGSMMFVLSSKPTYVTHARRRSIATKVATTRRARRVNLRRRCRRLAAQVGDETPKPLFGNLDAVADDEAVCAAGAIDGKNSCVEYGFGGDDALVIKTLRKCLNKRSHNFEVLPSDFHFFGMSQG